MNIVGRKIYFDKETGNVILTTSQMMGVVVGTTIEQDIASYKELNERVRETFDVIELEYGEYEQDFAESISYRVNPETKELEFAYREGEEPPEVPVYQKPLSEKVNELETQVNTQNEAIAELTMLMAMGM